MPEVGRWKLIIKRPKTFKTYRLNVVFQCIFEIVLSNCKLLDCVRINLNGVSDFYQTIHCRRLSGSHQTFDFSTGKLKLGDSMEIALIAYILGSFCQITDIDITTQFLEFAQPRSVNLQNLNTSKLIRQRDFELNLQTS